MVMKHYRHCAHCNSYLIPRGMDWPLWIEGRPICGKCAQPVIDEMLGRVPAPKGAGGSTTEAGACAPETAHGESVARGPGEVSSGPPYALSVWDILSIGMQARAGVLTDAEMVRFARAIEAWILRGERRS
jgi:hypothetical protein